MPAPRMFEEAHARYQINYRHQESEYPDFHAEPLLPHQFSRNGPGLAVADANNDNRDDFYVGAPSGQAGEIFFQQPDGTFRPQKLRLITNPKKIWEPCSLMPTRMAT
ncbi:MAG: hypothetical protein HC880_10500 [Bacteroidia bacterium]|nr:hypothetical protein [Bacteroidia bacterium]